jgi:hypothetical protein
MFDELTQYLGQMLRDVLDRGFQPLLYVANVAANGSAVFYRYDAPENAPGLVPTFLCEHMHPDGFALPINLMVVDQTGQAAHLVIQPETP